MKVKKDGDDIVRDFESRVMLYGMAVALIFRFIRIVHEYLTGSPTYVIGIGVFNFLLIVALFWLFRKRYLLALGIFYFQILLTSVLTWNNAGGWNGLVPYLFLVLIVAIVITSNGIFQIITLTTYLSVIILFGYSDILDSFSTPNGSYTHSSREADFLFSILMLIATTLFLKNSFFSFRESVELSNVQLEESSRTLAQQTIQLKEQQAELNVIRDNLEEITSGKINEVQDKAKKLKNYASINAHRVRGPLARILGLIYLLELENPDQQKSDALNKIKKEAEEMDVIVSRINEIIS